MPSCQYLNHLISVEVGRDIYDRRLWHLETGAPPSPTTEANFECQDPHKAGVCFMIQV